MRYILFGGEVYYAKGGGFDYITQSNSLEELTLFANKLFEFGFENDDLDIDWVHILDTENREIIYIKEYAHGSDNESLELMDYKYHKLGD